MVYHQHLGQHDRVSFGDIVVDTKVESPTYVHNANVQSYDNVPIYAPNHDYSSVGDVYQHHVDEPMTFQDNTFRIREQENLQHLSPGNTFEKHSLIDILK